MLKTKWTLVFPQDIIPVIPVSCTEFNKVVSGCVFKGKDAL